MRPQRVVIGRAVVALSVTALVLASILVVEYGQVQSLRSRPASVATTTVTATMTTSSSLASGAFEIFYQQEYHCDYMRAPWGVTIANETRNETEVQPPGGLQQLQALYPGEGEGRVYDANLSTIAFSLSNGVYNYTLLPSGLAGKNPTGTIRVAGADAVIQFPSDFCPP